MAVISVSIIQSGEELIAGIPRIISLSANIPCTIFYTLDGTDPTILSQNYLEPIVIPNGLNPVILKVFASNGTDTSPIITEEYSSDMANDNVRLPYSSTDAPSTELAPGNYPFGNPSIQPNATFNLPGNAGQNVNDPSLPQIPNGYNAEHKPDGYSNLPYNLENYSIRYTETNQIGQYGKGIGTIPGKVTIIRPSPNKEYSEQYTSMFDPKAMVIFQDVSKENPLDPPQINRQALSLEDESKVRYGDYFYNTGPDTPTATGTFVRSFFNPKDNTITYYYLDSKVNRWLISKAPYYPKGGFNMQLSGIVSNHKSKGSNKVFQWIPFTRRVLF